MGADLQAADLSDAHMERADLTGANLTRASLRGTALKGAKLRHAVLNLGHLYATDLRNADLTSATCRAAIFREAHLSQADLSHADLTCARLHDVDLCGATLAGATLTRVGLAGSVYDPHTRWPAGFDPAQHGALTLAERNQESWRDIIDFYERFISQSRSDRVAPLLRLVRRIEATDQARRFRAGQSLWHLIVSTAAKYGLKDDDPFVVVTLDSHRRFQVEYHDRFESDALGHPCRVQQVCGEQEVDEVVSSLLERLWKETRGQEPGAAIGTGGYLQ